jgi:hypothetical protein
VDEQQPEAPALPGVTRWRRRDWDVEAIQWTGANFEEVRDFASGALGIGGNGSSALPLWVARYHAVRRVEPGDWIIRESDGLRACPADLFAVTYEPAVSVPPVAAALEAPARLTGEQLDRIRQETAEWGEAVSAVRRGLNLTAALDDSDRRIIAAARDGLKVLSAEEGNGDV